MSNNNFDAILNRIKKNKEENTLSHAFIISCSDEQQRKKFAREAVKRIVDGDVKTNRKIDEENFEDLLIVKKDGDSIKVAQIEDMIASLKNKPFSCDIMLTIIEDGDCINEQSQNKLLKTLEEPSAGYVIFLLVSNPEFLAETIRSRCVIIKLKGESIKYDETCLNDAKNILSMTLFQEVAMSEVFMEIAKYDGRYPELLSAMMIFLRDIVVGTKNEALVNNKGNLDIAKRLSSNNEAQCRKCIYIIESTLKKLARGLDKKYSMRDMAVRIRQEANNG